MWFKNLKLYRLPSPWNVTRQQLTELLARRPFVACASQDMASSGFVPYASTDELAFAAPGFDHWMVTLQVEERLLPTKVVNEQTAARAAEIERQQGYRPGRKQLREIKEAVVQELLPRSFTTKRRTHAWIDPQNGWMGIDASTSTRADELIEALHNAMDELPLKLVDTERSPVSAMTDWLAGGEAPQNFTIDRDCELRAVTDEKAAVRYVRHPLEGGEIPAHLAAGKVPTQLALTFDDRISFLLTERLDIRRIGFLDVVQEQAQQAAASGDEQLEADFALMTAEFSRFIPHLIEALGGERVVA